MQRVVGQGSLLSINSVSHNQAWTRQFFLPCSGLYLFIALLSWFSGGQATLPVFFSSPAKRGNCCNNCEILNINYCLAE